MVETLLIIVDSKYSIDKSIPFVKEKCEEIFSFPLPFFPDLAIIEA